MTTLLVLPGMDGIGLMHEAFIAALGPGIEVRPVRYPEEAARAGSAFLRDPPHSEAVP